VGHRALNVFKWIVGAIRINRYLAVSEMLTWRDKVPSELTAAVTHLRRTANLLFMAPEERIAGSIAARKGRIWKKCGADLETIGQCVVFKQ